jgi:hypothetical protein
MHRHPRGCAVGVELDVERSHVGSEGEPGSNTVVLAERVVDSCVLISDGELLSRHAIVVRDLRDIPSSKAGRISVVASLHVGRSPIQVAMEVHLLARVLTLVYEVSICLPCGSYMEVTYCSDLLSRHPC